MDEYGNYTMGDRKTLLMQKVFLFLDAYVKMLKLKGKVEAGEVFETPVSLNALIGILNIRMKEIAALQESMGFDVGFPFNENSRFNGFAIESGELVGDLSSAYRISVPWMEKYAYSDDLSEDGFYKFFMGAFIFELTNYYNDEKITPAQMGAPIVIPSIGEQAA